MSEFSRVLKTGKNQITQRYNMLTHKGVDLVKEKDKTDYIIAHSSGVVVAIESNYKKTDKTGNSYGNYVKIKHNNGYYTLYAHLKYGSVTVKKGDTVNEGEVIGYMGNTGHSNGAHLHFEVRNSLDIRINPEPYLNANLPHNNFLVYQVYDNKKKKWLPLVKTDDIKDYAGNIGNSISGLKISNVTYRVHDRQKKKWLPAVSGDVSYAGNLPNDIDAISIESDEYKYQVHLKLRGVWLPYVDGYNVRSSKNGYAGNIGESIDAVRIIKK